LHRETIFSITLLVEDGSAMAVLLFLPGKGSGGLGVNKNGIRHRVPTAAVRTAELPPGLTIDA
jgi:hypothetical protein